MIEEPNRSFDLPRGPYAVPGPAGSLASELVERVLVHLNGLAVDEEVVHEAVQVRLVTVVRPAAGRDP